jgi:hypothetical protein
MANKIQYYLEDVKYEGKAYKKLDKVVFEGSKSGILFVPKRFSGRVFDVILIPKEVKEENLNEPTI